jgi:hypothetical protein
VTEASLQLDADSLAVFEAERMLRDVTATKHAAATMEALLAARVAAAGAFKRSGAKTPEEALANQTGTSVGAARRALETAKALGSGGATSEAARAGEISPEQAALISDAATANPGAEGSLLERAKAEGGSLKELDEACTNAKNAADPSPEDTYRRNRANRRLSFWNKGGLSHVFAQCTPDQMAAIKAAVEHRADELFHAAQATGDHQPRQAYLIDALEQICDEWLNGDPTDQDDDADDREADDSADGDDDDGDDDDGDDEGNEPGGKRRGKRRRRAKRPTWIGLVRADLEALRRGSVVGDELCEIAGLGPVPVDVARDLLGGDSVLHLVLTNGTAVGTTVNFKRGPTTAQRIALLFTQPRCDIDGCTNIFCQIDHVDDWAKTHTTTLKQLRRLCKHHHDLKTAGWAVIEDEHRTVIVPPDDPRHPKNNERPPP